MTLKEIFKQWLSKKTCHHEWEELVREEYATLWRIDFVCKKCGKIKRLKY